MRELDLSLVTFRPDFDLLSRLLASIAEQLDGIGAHLLIQDNSPDPATTVQLLALPALQPGGRFATVDVRHSGANLGFGKGHNACAARGSAAFLFVLNQDCILEPGTLAPLLELAANDDAKVAAWELRQIPYEHPKGYDPVTLESPWVSGAAVLLRRARLRIGRRLRAEDLHVRRGRGPVVAPAREGLAANLPAAHRDRASHLLRRQ